MNVLAPIAPKLVPLVRLLGSPVDGEVLAACRAIGRTLDTAGCDWHDLAAVIGGGAEPQVFMLYRDREPRRQTEPEPGSEWRDPARRCLGHFGDLRPVARRILRDIMRWRGEPTPKQMTWLLAIAEALGVDRRAA